MKLSDAWQIAERIAADAEAQGFDNTAEAMRQVLIRPRTDARRQDASANTLQRQYVGQKA